MVIYLVPHWEKLEEDNERGETDDEFFLRINKKYLDGKGDGDEDVE